MDEHASGIVVKRMLRNEQLDLRLFESMYRSSPQHTDSFFRTMAIERNRDALRTVLTKVGHPDLERILAPRAPQQPSAPSLSRGASASILPFVRDPTSSSQSARMPTAKPATCST